MSFLRNHPFPVEAFFEKSLVLGFALPKETIEDILPPRLELDLFGDKWAFLAIALVKTTCLRPEGFPKLLGRDFTLIGYRVFVRYRTKKGRCLRGLYILGSETDKRIMKVLGGIFTSYRYRSVGIEWASDGTKEQVSSSEGLIVKASRFSGETTLPSDSPFACWREARKFAGPMPFTFSCGDGCVTRVEGIRQEWKPTPMQVVESKIPFFDQMELDGIRLANAFLVENVPYRWKRGETERWAE